jgi:nucleoid-associated protein YgaU
MHSIERYGIVALLFLVVTIVAVLLWDEKGAEAAAPVGAAPAEASPPVAGRLEAPGSALRAPEVDARDTRGLDDRVVLTADTGPGPLTPGLVDRRGDERELEAAQESGRNEVAPVSPPATASLVPAPREEPAVQPRETLPSSGRTYAVQPGDTLSEIAQHQLGTSRRWQEIVAVNPGLDPNKLRVGQELKLPSADPGAPVASIQKPQPKKAPEAATKAPTYRVASGDSLWRIAQRTLGDGKRWREIAALNPRIDPDKLVAGAVLVLPGGARPGPTGTPRSEPQRRETPPVVASRSGESSSPRRGKVQ